MNPLSAITLVATGSNTSLLPSSWSEAFGGEPMPPEPMWRLELQGVTVEAYPELRFVLLYRDGAWELHKAPSSPGITAFERAIDRSGGHDLPKRILARLFGLE